ncbi:hypothetical protein MPH_02730 [Macrophomina phaseolina MS6]|uniref:Uncharacterized protein n=1 Tax=Macrophomina phaseolina (strain MS6) TaxID=1126212 RepID=K2STH4_MACPH|nr:hypothetical protein MPH_02730 [Macrophomina phaseolina MS6]
MASSSCYRDNCRVSICMSPPERILQLPICSVNCCCNSSTRGSAVSSRSSSTYHRAGKLDKGPASEKAESRRLPLISVLQCGARRTNRSPHKIPSMASHWPILLPTAPKAGRASLSPQCGQKNLQVGQTSAAMNLTPSM